MTELGQQISFFDLLNEEEKYVRRIEGKDAAPFIREIHYSRKVPCVMYAFGMFVGGEMIGVVTYGKPASNPLCVGLAGEENSKNVIELNRLVIKPGYNGKNYASYLVSHSLKMLPNNTYVVSYADPSWTHVGYVYQACNFLYTGLSSKHTDYHNTDGKHQRSVTRGKHQTDVLQTRIQKHRYVYLVGDRRTRKGMLKSLKYPIVTPYPKGDEIHYDIDNPQPVQRVEKIDRKKPYRPRREV